MTFVEKWRHTVTLGVLLLAALSIAAGRSSYWIDRSIETHYRQSSDCAQCHKGSTPRTHTATFIQVSHGLVAQLNRQQCTGCHTENECNACHRKEPPLWHSTAFRHPDRGVRERVEHSHVADGRSSSCLECHQHAFHDQCSKCHRPDEWTTANVNRHATLFTKTDK